MLGERVGGGVVVEVVTMLGLNTKQNKNNVR